MPSLEFKGKQFIYTHHLGVPFRTLEIDQTRSLSRDGTPNMDDNLIIHGDNLHALKALLPTYAGKVKCIYIDPPYNTGTEGWCYNDRVNSPLMREWLKKEANPVDKEDLERHDKWLCMMWPRLQLLRQLLSDEGFIFVNIDNNEHHRLRLLLDEIFGEECFKNEIVTRRGVKNVQSQFETIDALSTGHDTVLLYAKSTTSRLPKLLEISDSDEPGKWDTFWRGTDRPTMRYELFGQIPESGQWRWSEGRGRVAVDNYEEYLAYYSSNLSLDEYWALRLQELGAEPDFVRLGPENTVQYYVGPRNYKVQADVWLNIRTSGNYTDFPHEKHVQLVERIIRWVCSSEDIVLDSFAGSGTTAHAVLALNKKDGGNRKFILVEMEDYADQVTAERVRRVIHGVPNAKDAALKEGLGGSFTYCTLGEEINIASLLRGENVPSYEALARYVFYTATGKTLSDLPKLRRDWFIGETDIYTVHLIYQPDREFLRSQDAALNAEMVDIITDGKGKKAIKKALVFAAVKFMGQKDLTERNIEFCQLPYAIHRILGD